MPSDDNPLGTSWSGDQTKNYYISVVNTTLNITVCERISVVNTFVNLEKVLKGLTSKCNKTETLNIKADVIIIPKDLEFTDLKKLTIMCNQLLVQNSASKLSFKQSAQSNGDDGRPAILNGNNGGDGCSGTSGTEVTIQARDLYTEGPFVVQVQGGKGGNGGKGSHGIPGKKGDDGKENSLWESEGWPHMLNTFGRRYVN